MQVSKWGASLAVRLPKKLVDEMGLRAGDELNVVQATGETIAVEKEKDRRRQKALANMRTRRWTAPVDYIFDRDEANER
jgi:antitoxin MazE